MSESVVYYLRRGDLIKIGWSGNLKARMRALRPDALLAVEPGCMHLETGRHHQFDAHRLPNDGNGDEWFTPAPELLAHIELLARMYPTPDLAELMPASRRSGVELVAVVPAVSLDASGAARRLQALSGVDIETASVEELVALRAGVATVSTSAVATVATELACRGRSWRQVGAALGVDHTTAYGWVRDAGLLTKVNAARATRQLAQHDPEGETPS